MNDNFTLLIFTYHNVFHIASCFFEAEKMAASCTGVVGCPSDVTWRACYSPSRPRSNPAPLGYDQDQFSKTQNWVKTTQRPYPAGLNPAFGLKKQPSVFLECTRTHTTHTHTHHTTHTHTTHTPQTHARTHSPAHTHTHTTHTPHTHTHTHTHLVADKDIWIQNLLQVFSF